MTTATTDDVTICWQCGGPCLTYKGSVHGWTCQGCIAQYLEQSAARGDDRTAKEREKNARKLSQRKDIQSLVTADRDRDGRGPDVFRTAVPASVTNRLGAATANTPEGIDR